MVAGISETPIENLGSLRACPLPSCPISAASYDLCRFCREHAELFDNPVGRVVGCPVALVGGVTEPSGDPHKIANLGLLIDIFPLAVEIGSAHVRNPVTNEHTVCSLILAKQTK